jgi:hypothetical protein
VKAPGFFSTRRRRVRSGCTQAGICEDEEEEDLVGAEVPFEGAVEDMMGVEVCESSMLSVCRVTCLSACYWGLACISTASLSSDPPGDGFRYVSSGILGPHEDAVSSSVWGAACSIWPNAFMLYAAFRCALVDVA